MSVEAWQAIKRLEARVGVADKVISTHANTIVFLSENLRDALEQLASLKNQYKMLNARMNKKNNGETDRE